jgi:hypothetical protein
VLLVGFYYKNIRVHIIVELGNPAEVEVSRIRPTVARLCGICRQMADT